MSKVIGIDVSKATFDVSYYENDVWNHYSYSNNKKGFDAFLKEIDIETTCVMEASGPYYLQLATYLNQRGVGVSVVNPLTIKRFSQMRLQRAKTDKKDAQTIAEYGRLEDPKLWQPASPEILELQQLFTIIESIHKQRCSINNQLEAFQSSGVVNKEVFKSLKSLLKSLDNQENRLEGEIEKIVFKHYKASFEYLTSIPGIGKKAATMLIMTTQNFTKFSNYKQLIAYVGFSPRIYQSGTSVKGKGHICKMGKSQLRKVLYLCSWSAKRYNRSCIEMYERLKIKGKPERVIKIALANKLLKQAFAIGTKQIMYTENYTTNTCF